MRALPGAVVLVVLLAGCADEPEPLPAPPEPVYSDVPGFQPGPGVAPVAWQTFWEGDFVLAPANPIEADVTMPSGVLQVLVNLTTDGGAAYGITVDLGECHWRRDLAVLSQGGETYGADCGGLLAGTSRLSVSIDAGALAGHAVVAGMVCDPLQGRCPERLPATKA